MLKKLPPKPEKPMIRKHKTTAEMVKQLLNVIEDRVERANQKPAPHSNRLDSTLEQATM